MKCDCRYIDHHEEWCSSHPLRYRCEEAERQIVELHDNIAVLQAKLDVAIKALEKYEGIEVHFHATGGAYDPNLETFVHKPIYNATLPNYAEEALKQIRGEKNVNS